MDCLTYAREKVVKRNEDGTPKWDRLGAHYYFPYTLRRDTEKYGKNVSVHAGHKFYDDKTMTLKTVVEECYGVCGMISTVAATVAQSMGCPATTIGQPGHCALIWARPENNSWIWQIYNNVGGLAKGTHGGNPYNDLTRNVWPFYAFDECSRNPYNLVKSTMALVASNSDAGIKKKNALMAVSKCNWNIYGWIALSNSHISLSDFSHLYKKGEVAVLQSAAANISAEEGHRENTENNKLYRAAILGDRDAMSKLKPAGPLAAVMDGSQRYHCFEDKDTLTIDFEGVADVDRVEIQWLSKAIPEKVEFLADGKKVVEGSLRASSAGWKDIWSVYDLNLKNCSKLDLKLTGSTGSYEKDGLTIKLGIKHLKVLGSISPDSTTSALCLAFHQTCVEKSPKNQARNIISEFVAKNYFDKHAESETVDDTDIWEDIFGLI